MSTGAATFELLGLTWEVYPLDPDEQIEVECIVVQALGPSLGAALASVLQSPALEVVDVLKDAVSNRGELARVRAAMEAQLKTTHPESRVERDEDALVLVYADAAAAAADAEELAVETDDIMDASRVGAEVRLTVTDEVMEDAAKPFDLRRLGDLDTSDPRLELAWAHFLDAIQVTGAELTRDAIFALVGRLDYHDIKRLFDLVILKPTRTVAVFDGKPAYIDSYEALATILKRRPFAKWELLGRALWVTYGPAPKPEEASGTQETG